MKLHTSVLGYRSIFGKEMLTQKAALLESESGTDWVEVLHHGNHLGWEALPEYPRRAVVSLIRRN